MGDKPERLFGLYEPIGFPYDMDKLPLHEEIKASLRKKLNNFDESMERRFRENVPKVGKTGGWGNDWIELEKPKPPRVADHYKYWGEAPPEISQRCLYWVRQIERGWRPNRRIPDCYCCGSEWYGVYIWEYMNVIRPLLNEKRTKTS